MRAKRKAAAGTGPEAARPASVEAIGQPATAASTGTISRARAVAAPSAAPAVSEDSGAARPSLRLAAPRRIAAAAAAGDRHPPSVRPAAPPAMDGRRLAAMTASEFAVEPDGRTTVTFASPVVPLQRTPAPTVSAPASVPPAPAPAPAPTATASEPDSLTGTPAADAPPGRRGPAHEQEELDHIYEQMLERLRRDLVVERERAGHLLGGLSWGS